MPDDQLHCHQRDYGHEHCSARGILYPSNQLECKRRFKKSEKHDEDSETLHKLDLEHAIQLETCIFKKPRMFAQYVYICPGISLRSQQYSIYLFVRLYTSK